MKILKNPPELEELVKLHETRKKTLLGLASWYLPKVTDGFVDGLQFAASVGSGPDLAVVSYGKARSDGHQLLIFDLSVHSLEEWIAALRAIRIPKPPTKPDKVKIQKVGTRILRLYKLLAEVDRSIKAIMQWVDTYQSGWTTGELEEYQNRGKEETKWFEARPAWSSPVTAHEAIITLKYIQSAPATLRDLPYHLKITAEDQVRELELFLSEDQITDEMWTLGAKDALDRLLCTEVMDS